ncbi:MAG TPA: hypothetical protein VMB78_07160, partial [Dissulfurispiraceae bacterium]|nr:hypothetical protein [Dissulfurispiraceae bacterium]
TSGLIGPFYVNTHYLAGGRVAALELLDLITEHPQGISAIHQKVMEIHETHPIFRDIIRKAIDLIKTSADVSRIDFVSGGERRDWFFHSIVAELLDKPALFIYKDASVIVKEGREVGRVDSIEGANVLHVADLVTIASSYVKVWVPAVKQLGGAITHALNIVDRCQGASKVLKGCGIATMSLAKIDVDLFHAASQRGYISRAQHGMIVDYLRDPFTTMKKFLLENPEFLKDSLASDEAKIAARARQCLADDLYKLNLA